MVGWVYTILQTPRPTLLVPLYKYPFYMYHSIDYISSLPSAANTLHDQLSPIAHLKTYTQTHTHAPMHLNNSLLLQTNPATRRRRVQPALCRRVYPTRRRSIPPRRLATLSRITVRPTAQRLPDPNILLRARETVGAGIGRHASELGAAGGGAGGAR